MGKYYPNEEPYAIPVRVEVIGIGQGTITHLRYDAFKDAIYTVKLDDSTATPEGLFYARSCEMRRI